MAAIVLDSGKKDLVEMRLAPLAEQASLREPQFSETEKWPATGLAFASPAGIKKGTPIDQPDFSAAATACFIFAKPVLATTSASCFQ